MVSKLASNVPFQNKSCLIILENAARYPARTNLAHQVFVVHFHNIYSFIILGNLTLISPGSAW